MIQNIFKSAKEIMKNETFFLEMLQLTVFN